MSLEFFEPRPPKSAAIKLDFLNNPDHEVAEKLRAMPLVDAVAIEYSSFGRSVVINPGGGKSSFSFGLSPDFIGDDHWLVCTPPPLDSLTLRGELEVVQDRTFHRRYQACESESLTA